jgi:hypothetical protein
MYEVVVNSSFGNYTVDIFESFEPAEESALDQFKQSARQMVSIIDTNTGKHVFILESAA